MINLEIQRKREQFQERDVARRAAETALQRIRERYETGPIGNRLDFHNVAHTQGVIRRALRIALALEVSHREMMQTQIAGAFHDVVQDWEPATQPDGSIKRQRKEGENERASAQEAEEWMKGQVGIVFKNTDYDHVRTAIHTTIAQWNPDLHTPIQPDLTPDTRPVARAIALGDLGTAGMEPHMFRLIGDRLFLEQEVDVARALRAMKSLQDIPMETQQAYLRRYQEVHRGQIAFARGRQARFESEIEGVSKPAKDNLRELFSGFDVSIAHAEKVAAAVNQYTFNDMVLRLVSPAL